MDYALIQQLVNVLITPLVAALFIAVGSLLILLDLLTSGFGLAGILGIGLFVLFFWAHTQAGLAGWEGIVLVVLGLALLGVEAFLVPGFGVAGVLGIIAVLSGVYVSVLGKGPATADDLRRAAYTIAGTLALMIAGSFALIRMLPHSPRFRKLILHTHVGSLDVLPPAARQTGYFWRWIEGARLEAQTSSGGGGPITDRLSVIGVKGVAISALRPAGTAEIGGQRVDVVSEGAYIPAGTPIKVVADEGYRRVVRPLSTDM